MNPLLSIVNLMLSLYQRHRTHSVCKHTRRYTTERDLLSASVRDLVSYELRRSERRGTRHDKISKNLYSRVTGGGGEGDLTLG